LTDTGEIENNTMEIKRFTIPFEIKADDGNSSIGTFSGYGSIFGNIDLGGDIVLAGAFTKSLMEWQRKNALPSLFGFHKNDNPIGDWLEMREDEKGLFVRGQLWVKGEARIEQAIVAHNMMKGTGPKGLSIGYRTIDYEIIEHAGGQVRQLKELDLLEVSVVGLAMNQAAMVEDVKSLKNEEGKIVSKREAEKILRDAGLSKKQSKAFIAGGYDAISCDAEERNEAKNRDDSLVLGELLSSLKAISI